MISSRFDLLVSGCQILTMDDSMNIWNDGALVVDKGKIVYCGPVEKIPEGWTFADRYDASGKIAMPPFFNSHNHAAMSIFRGLGNDLSLNAWLNQFIWPAESRNINPDTVYLATMLSAMEMVLSGTAVFSDMYFFEEEVGRASEEIGMRAILGEGILDFPTPSRSTPQETFEQTRHLADKYAHHSLINVAVAAHAPYTCSPDVLSGAAELAHDLKIPANIHVAETGEEFENLNKRYGKSPVRYLFDLGFLGSGTVIHHAIYLNPEDVDILAETGTNVATIPNSNMKLGSGVCPVPLLIEKGINVSIGTDGPASNNNQSMIRELQLLGRLQKVTHGDPTILPADQLVRMATINGARAYGLESGLGSLEAGKQADFILINTDKPHWYPRFNPYTSIAYSMHSSDVESVMVNGNFILKNRLFTTIDSDKILQEIRSFVLK